MKLIERVKFFEIIFEYVVNLNFLGNVKLKKQWDDFEFLCEIWMTVDEIWIES